MYYFTHSLVLLPLPAVFPSCCGLYLCAVSWKTLLKSVNLESVVSLNMTEWKYTIYYILYYVYLFQLLMLMQCSQVF